MSTKNKVVVRIADREYTLVGKESADYLKKVAECIDSKYNEIWKANPALDTGMLTMLTCVNLADEYFKALNTENLILEDKEKLNREKEHMNARLELVLRETELLREKNAALLMELAKKELQINEMKSTLERNSKIRFYSKSKTRVI